MLRLTQRISAAALALALFAGLAQAAQADYGVVTIQNPSNGTINYQFRWGENGEWKTYRLQARYDMAHYIPLDANGQAPRPYIRYDDGTGLTQTYSLEFYASIFHDTLAGKPYEFRWQTNGVLQLFSK